MATIDNYRSSKPVSDALHNGDSLKQKEFHKLYKQMPEGFRAELIHGIVFVREPGGHPHGISHLNFAALVAAYRGLTPGTDAGDNITVILSDEDEVQPDLYLRIQPLYGGQSGNISNDMYIMGAPELVVEVAHSSRSIDLSMKKQRYAQAGVIEYIVACLQPFELFWFDLPSGKRFRANDEGIYASAIFPGLWIDEKALKEENYQKFMNVLNRGIASPEHSAFVAKLNRQKS